MSNDKEKFIPGLYFDLPREGAPEFSKGSMTLDLDRFIPWAIERAKSEPRLRLNLNESREGKGYAQINDWKPKSEGKPSAKPAPAYDEDSIPF